MPITIYFSVLQSTLDMLFRWSEQWQFEYLSIVTLLSSCYYVFNDAPFHVRNNVVTFKYLINFITCAMSITKLVESETQGIRCGSLIWSTNMTLLEVKVT